jgi:hypothetical protein
MAWDTYMNVVAIIYVIAAGFTLVEVVRHWRELFDAQFTAEDYSLASRVGFLWLTPIGVFAHELGHFLVAQQLGARNLELHFFAYWGFVSYIGRLTPEWHFFIAAAGPFVSLVLGGAAVIGARWVPNPYRTALEQFGISTLVLILILYPAMSFSGFGGDFLGIYSRQTPVLSAVAGAVHLASLVAFVVAMRGRQPPPRPAAPAPASPPPPTATT